MDAFVDRAVTKRLADSVELLFLCFMKCNDDFLSSRFAPVEQDISRRQAGLDLVRRKCFFQEGPRFLTGNQKAIDVRRNTLFQPVKITRFVVGGFQRPLELCPKELKVLELMLKYVWNDKRLAGITRYCFNLA